MTLGIISAMVTSLMWREEYSFQVLSLLVALCVVIQEKFVILQSQTLYRFYYL
jgi:hypothetical protein